MGKFGKPFLTLHFLMSDVQAPTYRYVDGRGKEHFLSPQYVTTLCDGRIKANYGPGIIGHTDGHGNMVIVDRKRGTTTTIPMP